MKTNTLKNRSKMLLIAGMLTMCVPGISQNVLSNGNFEYFHSQPPHYQQVNGSWNQSKFAQSWTTASEASPDLFTDHYGGGTNFACGNEYDPNDNPQSHGCYPEVCPLENFWGEQAPHSGDNFVGIRCAGVNGGGYEYIQTTFAPLTEGQCYRLTFWTSRSDLSTKAVRIQAVISDGSIEDLNSTALLNPYVVPTVTVLTAPTFITSKTTWTLVTLEFIAEGGEDHLTMGMFEPQGIQDPNDPTGATYLPTVQTESTATGTCGISTSNDPCSQCAVAIDAYYYIDDVVLEETADPAFVPSAGCIFTNANPTLSGSYSNKNILISGDVVLGANVTFTTCTVKCNTGATITVPNGKTFTILNSILSAGCYNMWDGIVVEGRIEVQGSTIKDAYCAISTEATTASWSIKRSTAGAANYFQKNLVDISIYQWVTSTTNEIKATTFDHTALLNNNNLLYGTYGIVFNGAGSSLAEVIGGTSTNDYCYFYGGISGIKAYYYPVTVNHGFFSGQAGAAIDFQGIATSGAHRKLTVLNSTFMQAKNHIYAANLTDLTIEGSSFNYAYEHSVVWANNRNGELKIGDMSNSALGNTFQFNQWACIIAWANKTNQANLATLAANTNHAYTEISIANNTFNCPTWGSGIILSEWALGSSVSYRSLEIYYNEINSVHQGIQLSNIRGWGGTNYANQPSRIASNYVGVSTLTNANSFGIKATNAGGLNIAENGINSPNWGNYVNRGIIVDNVDHTVVNENIIQAGTGILVGGWQYQSDLWCNWLLNYSAGFSLAYSYLRPGPTDPHGEIGYKQYSNLVPYTTIPWNDDIFVWNSDVQYNKWMWNGAATNLDITLSGSCGSGSLISTYTATDRCNDFTPGMSVYSGASERIDLTLSDPVAQWRADYTYEVYRLMNGTGDTTVASSNIKKIINAENLINLELYDDALTVLAGITPANDVEEHYVDVLTIFATINDEARTVTTGEYDDLITIAQLQTYEEGPAVSLSRAYLRVFYNLTFEDARPLEAYEIHGTATVSSPCGIEPTSDTWLSFIDEDGNDLGIEGTYISADGSFIFDPNETNYYAQLHEETPFRIFSRYGSKYTVVSYDYHTLSEWLTASPFNLDLAGISVEIDTTTSAELESITNYTSMDDDENNTYSVGWVEGAGKDFLIEKRDRYNTVVWTRTWDGPVSGDDEATCMYLDGEANVYVAGKVSNGKNYDIQILKYDTDGNLVWSAMFACAEEVDNSPTGITWNEADGTVEMIGTCGENYRYIKVWQCLPGGERYGQENPEQIFSAVPQPSFYPSPSNGKITVALNGQSAGMLELFTLEGQVVYSQQITQSGDIELPVSVVNGVYLLKFTGEGEPYHQKLVIQRTNE